MPEETQPTNAVPQTPATPTPQRDSLQSAELERERLTSLINSMGDGVLAIDEHGQVVISNGAAQNILDVNTSLNGKAIKDILTLHDKTNLPIDVPALIAETKTSVSSREWRLQYGDGEIVNLYTSISPVRLGYGQQGMKGHVILLRDITREKSLEEERDEFISVISHELRTPITIAEGNIGNAQFIFEKSGSQDQKIADTLRQAHDQITFLAGMINDLATLSRAERGKLQVEPESINAHDLLADLAKTYEPEATAKNLVLKTDLAPNLEVLRTSRLYLREILQNFVTNSLKYTDKGSITIGAQPKDGGILFFVSDTGIGISKADQQKVFEKFFRSEDYRTRQNSGTGLGLYITMKLAKLIQGTIALNSEVNKGSTFSILVPNLA